MVYKGEISEGIVSLINDPIFKLRTTFDLPYSITEAFELASVSDISLGK